MGININNLPKFKPDGTPILTYGEAVERYKAGTLDAKAKNEMDRMIADWRVAIDKIAGSATEAFAQLVSGFEAYRSQFNEMLAATVSRYAIWLQQLDEPLREALVVLGENGWFLCMSLPFDAIWELRETFEKGDAVDAESALMDYFEERLDAIEKAVTGKFPSRSKVLKAAFGAHRKGEFELSIPVFLAQSDGICKEVFNGYIFKSRKNQPEAAAFVETITNDILTRSVLTPLTLKFPINRSISERPADFKGFNRHEVLHGDSVDYGTSVNSLKAVSLLNYVATVFDTNR